MLYFCKMFSDGTQYFLLPTIHFYFSFTGYFTVFLEIILIEIAGQITDPTSENLLSEYSENKVLVEIRKIFQIEIQKALQIMS